MFSREPPPLCKEEPPHFGKVLQTEAAKKHKNETQEKTEEGRKRRSENSKSEAFERSEASEDLMLSRKPFALCLEEPPHFGEVLQTEAVKKHKNETQEKTEEGRKRRSESIKSEASERSEASEDLMFSREPSVLCTEEPPHFWEVLQTEASKKYKNVTQEKTEEGRKRRSENRKSEASERSEASEDLMFSREPFSVQ